VKSDNPKRRGKITIGTQNWGKDAKASILYSFYSIQMFLAPFPHLFSFLFLFSYHFPTEVRVNFAFLFFPLRGNRGRLPPSLLQILSTTWLDPFLGSTRNRFWEEWDELSMVP